MADSFTHDADTYSLTRDGQTVWSGIEVGLLWDEQTMHLHGYGDAPPLFGLLDSLSSGRPILAVSSSWEADDLNRVLASPDYLRHLPLWGAMVRRRAIAVDGPALAHPPHRARHEMLGTVQRIIYDRDGFTVLEAITPDRQRFTAAGNASALALHTTYVFLGRWAVHAQYGERFVFEAAARDVPMTRQGVIAYFRSALQGIGFGPRAAEKVWALYGHASVTEIAADPTKVHTDTGIPLDTLERAGQLIVRDGRLLRTKVALHSLLAGRGFPHSIIDDCMQLWNVTAPEKIRQNPFLLLSERLAGAGFKRVDKLYGDLALPPSSLVRQAWCAWDAVGSSRSGDTWLRRFQVRASINAALGTSAEPERAIDHAVSLGLLQQVKRDGQCWLTTPEMAAGENDLFEAIVRLRSTPVSLWPSPDALPGLSDHQREQLAAALSSPVAVLAGYPGTGKSLCSMAVVRYLLTQGLTVGVCAPTGKAAVRCTELLAGTSLIASTIHRLLHVQRHSNSTWSFEYGPESPLPCDVIVIDEASVADVAILRALFTACATGTHILVVGDPYQLPPIGHGAPLRDLIAGSGAGLLTEVHRNGGRIALACKAIRERQPIVTSPRYEPPFENLRHQHADSPSEIIRYLRSFLKAVRQKNVFDVIDDVQILCIVNSAGDLSRESLNPIVQAECNPDGQRSESSPYRVGDKIICLKNAMRPPMTPPLMAGRAMDATAWSFLDEEDDVFVANGDVGRVLAISPTAVIGRFTSPDRVVRLLVSQDDSPDFALGYAITAHKFQGSQSPVTVVILDPDSRADRVASRELAYTMLSRAEKLCIVLGDLATLSRWCRNDALSRRQTFLGDMLREL